MPKALGNCFVLNETSTFPLRITSWAAQRSALPYCYRRGILAQNSRKRRKALPSLGQPQDARESVCCQMSGGLAPLTYILYEEIYDAMS